MNSEMRELYQQTILSHNKNPLNYRVIENSSHYAEGRNPLCGDVFDVYVQVEEDKTISDISRERIMKVIKKIQNESNLNKFNMDLGFKFYKLKFKK